MSILYISSLSEMGAEEKLQQMYPSVQFALLMELSGQFKEVVMCTPR